MRSLWVIYRQNEEAPTVEHLAVLQMVIKAGIYHQCAIRRDRALRSFGPENILAWAGFHSVCLKLTHCRWCESEQLEWGVVAMTGTRERGKGAWMGGCRFHSTLPRA